ncbi:hypothetical protein CROQUDRAFT_59549 [Cronartium quercuum f. sp. fusiforme G11]|uniref:Uncharacterized protein n=1 Tax=Cronartium quercuum f. sp. fusiforme G11 TaxID=708437 RepID=A0A9P6NLI6_9BASI|nr:hypothetical protein CROQUDRAFT_59549 [Cronartium quercuum f. sp. fusiforme G11]
MPKLQFMTIHLTGLDGKIIAERRRKPTHSCSDLFMSCDLPRGGLFGVRLSSSPLPFDVVVKVWVDNVFSVGRCFLAGNSEPIIEYDISTIRKDSRSTPSEVQVTIHKCCVGERYASYPSSESDAESRSQEKLEQDSLPPSPLSSCGTSFFRRGYSDQVAQCPVILYEDSSPYLKITWSCKNVEV